MVNSTTGKEPVNPFETPQTGGTRAVNNNKSKPVAKGKQKVFKQIKIYSSEDEDSENQEDYVPPKNYEDDYDDDSEDDNSGSEQDVQEILDEIKKDVPEVSKLSR